MITHKDFKEKPKFLLFFNTKFKTYIVLPYDPLKRSMSRLKNKLSNTLGIRWKYFITLTFALEEDIPMKGFHVRPDIDIKIGNYNYKDSGFIAYDMPQIHKYTKCLENINFELTPNLITKFLDNLRHWLKNHNWNNNFDYSWKYEEGGRTKRPHFHLLLDSKFEMCWFPTYWVLLKLWKSGLIDVKRIYNDEHLSKYLHKDFTKEGSFSFFKGRKKWGTSKGLLIALKSKSLEFRKYINNKSEALLCNLLHKKEIDIAYGKGTADALNSKIEFMVY